MKTGIVVVLCSPDFLYVMEPSVDEQTRGLTTFELAARLSYFLWSSMPDDELFSLAKNGRLSDAAVLSSQVDRMLADNKSEGLVKDFANQWLKVYEFDKFG